jgi:hypothetical protein
MDQSLKHTHDTISLERHGGKEDTARSVLDQHELRGEIIVPSTAAWSEGLSLHSDAPWAGY